MVTLKKIVFVIMFACVSTLLQAQAPLITSVTPASGPIGTLVKISGSNLSSPTTFSIGGVNAIVISNDGNTLVGMVMPGATNGAITVTTSGGTITQGIYTVTAPVLPTVQQGAKQVPNDMVGKAQLGYRSSLSADGNTLLVGSVNDSGIYNGAAWIYVRSNGIWTKQVKWVNPGTQGALFGKSVDLSADGNTAIVGASLDNAGIGASYIYVRNGTTWTLQSKLIGSDYAYYAAGGVGQGGSVSLSADGNVALIGGFFDDSPTPGSVYGYGAVWIFRRNGTTWTQDGPKLKSFISDAFGANVDLSADGNTALIVDGYQGFVFVYKNGAWLPEGTPLTNPATALELCALSADGNVALLGGETASPANIVAHVFMRSSGVWSSSSTLNTNNQPTVPYTAIFGDVSLSADGTVAMVGGGTNTIAREDVWLFEHQGQNWNLVSKLHGSGASGFAYQGSSSQLSSDGQTAVIGGLADNNFAGAFWTYSGAHQPSITLTASTATSKRNTEVLIPITVKNFNNIVSSQFEITWDHTVATFIDVENYGLNGMDQNSFGLTQVAAGKLIVSWIDPGLVPQTKADASSLFSIRFKLTGNYGASTAININNIELSEPGTPDYQQVDNVTSQSGTLNIDPALSLTGKVLYPNKDAIQSAQVALSGPSTQSNSTDNNGVYTFTIAPTSLNESYLLTPSKNNDPGQLNGIDVQDVALIRRHILQTQSLTTPYQLIAADVNQSKSVSTLDIVFVQALILGKATSFPNNALWTFLPADYSFSNPLSPYNYPVDKTLSLSQLEASPSVDFTAIKLGDVNDSRDNSQSGRVSSNETVTFDIREEIVLSENEIEKNIEIPVRVKDFNAISGYQFTITWDVDKLEYMDAENKMTSSLFGNQRINDGALTVIWDDVNGNSTTLGDNNHLLALKFKSINGGGYQDVNINSAITEAKVYNSSLGRISYSVTKTELEKSEQDILTSIYPNPFMDLLNFRFYSSENDLAKIKVTDVTGRPVFTADIAITKGINEWQWPGTDANDNIQNAGVYIIHLQTANGLERMKVVKR